MNKTDIFIPMKLANALIAKRTKGDISFTQAADQTGIAKMVLHRAECGDVPKLENFYAMCLWLDMPMEAFFAKPAKSKKK